MNGPTASLEHAGIPWGRRPLALLLGLGAAALLAGPLAYYAFFASFQDYDDEGYLLISLRDYARGGVLYDEVYSQYGPAYFQLLTPVFRIARLAFRHTDGRALALALMIATAILSAAALWRLSRSLLIALAGQLLVAQVLVQSRDEPLHPGALLALLLAGLVLVATALDGRRWRLAAVVGGALLGTMLLMKINVGVFAASGVAGALVAASLPGRLGATLRVVVLAGMIAIPVGLLGPRADDPAVRAYLVVALAAVMGVQVVAVTEPGGRAPVAGLAWTLAAGAAVALVASAGGELARGTSPASLLEGIVLGPLRHPAEFFTTPDLGWHAVVLAFAGLAAAIGFAWARGHGLVVRPPGSILVGLTQLLAGLGLWLGVASYLPVSRLALVPLLWVALASRPAEAGRLGVLVLTMVAAFQTLHAYPIPGTQVAWATFLAIPVGGVALVDGWRRARTGLAEAGLLEATSGRVVGVALGIALAGVIGSSVYAFTREMGAAYREGVSFGLPGAERIRVPAEQAALYRHLVGTLITRCRAFVTQPGLASLHLFTGIEPPSRLNATVWMLLLTDAQQEEIVERLRRAPTPVCAVRRQRRVFTTPLARYIEERFDTLFEVDYFEFRVRREPAVP